MKRLKDVIWQLTSALLFLGSLFLIGLGIQITPSVRLASAASPTPPPPNCTACSHSPTIAPQCSPLAAHYAQETEALDLIDAQAEALGLNVEVDLHAVEVYTAAKNQVQGWIDYNIAQATRLNDNSWCWRIKTTTPGSYNTFIINGPDGDTMMGNWYSYQLNGYITLPVRGKRNKLPTPQAHTGHCPCPIYLEEAAPGINYHDYMIGFTNYYGKKINNLSLVKIEVEHWSINFPQGTCDIANGALYSSLNNLISFENGIKLGLLTSLQSWQGILDSDSVAWQAALQAAIYQAADYDTAGEDLVACYETAFPKDANEQTPTVCGCE